MKQEIIMDALNELDEEYIRKADEARRGSRQPVKEDAGGSYSAEEKADRQQEIPRYIRNRAVHAPAEEKADRQQEIRQTGTGKRTMKQKGLKYAAAAACAALAVYAGLRMFPAPEGDPGSRDVQQQDLGTLDSGGALEETELPMLSIKDTDIDKDTETEWGQESMGYEGYQAYDISELVNGNPWNQGMEDSITSLPVYKNRLTYQASTGKMTGGSFEDMRAFLLEIAQRLKMDTETLEITDDAPDAETQEAVREKFASTGEEVPDEYFAPTALLAEKDGIEIKVDEAMTAEIVFQQPAALPAEYHFDHNASYEEMTETAEYLKIAYGDLLGTKDLWANVHGGGYDSDLRQSYQIEFFEDDEDAKKRLINYHFRRAAFYSSEGKLYMVRIYRPDLSQEMGDYPVITSEEAKELLLNKNYITTAPCEFPGESYIVKSELIYRNTEMEKYYMPYYRFYVELPEYEKEQGLKTFGAYYVPAVEAAYISNMPVWDGNF